MSGDDLPPLEWAKVYMENRRREKERAERAWAEEKVRVQAAGLPELLALASPRPWRVDDEGAVLDRDGYNVIWGQVELADAHLIVRVVNAAEGGA